MKSFSSFLTLHPPHPSQSFLKDPCTPLCPSSPFLLLCSFHFIRSLSLCVCFFLSLLHPVVVFRVPLFLVPATTTDSSARDRFPFLFPITNCVTSDSEIFTREIFSVRIQSRNVYSLIKETSIATLRIKNIRESRSVSVSSLFFFE